MFGSLGPLGSLFDGLFGLSYDAIKAGQEQQRLAAEFDYQRAKAANPAVTAVYVGPKLLEAPKEHR